MKKYILALIAILIMASALMAEKVVIARKDTNSPYILKIDGEIVLETTNIADIDNYFEEQNRSGIGDWANVKYDGCRLDEYGHVIEVYCHTPAVVNDCAKKAAKLM